MKKSVKVLPEILNKYEIVFKLVLRTLAEQCKRRRSIKYTKQQCNTNGSIEVFILGILSQGNCCLDCETDM